MVTTKSKFLTYSVFVIFAAFLFSETYEKIFYWINGTVIFFFVYIFSFVLLIREKQLVNGISLVVKEKFIFILITIVIFSTLWSVEKIATVNGAITLIGTLLFSVFIVKIYSFSDFMRLLLIYSILFCFLNYVFILVNDAGIGTGNFEGSWHGMLGQKNRFGIYLAITFLVSMLTIKDSNLIIRFISLVTILFSFFLILKSDSKTALIVSTIMIIFVLLSWLLKINKNLLYSILFILTSLSTVIVYLILTNQKIFTELTGFDFTLTGRVQIFSVLYQFIKDTNFIGYGYNAFWNSNYSVLFNNKLVYNETVSAHNGYIEVLLSLGIFSLLFLLIALGMYIIKASVIYRKTNNRVNLFFISFLCLFIIYNFTESLFLLRNNFITVIFFSSAFYMYEYYKNIK